MYKLAKLILVIVWVVASYSTLNINAGECDKQKYVFVSS